MISSHQHHLMRILFPYSKTEVPGNIIQVFQQHINQKYRVIRKREMQLTFISIFIYHFIQQRHLQASLDSLLKWLVDVQKICHHILVLQLGFQAGIMCQGPSVCPALPCSKEEEAGRVSCHSTLSTSWSISVMWVKDKGCYRQRKRRHFCHVGRDNLWAECWHEWGTEPPTVHVCLHACIHTSLGQESARHLSSGSYPCLRKPASLTVKVLFPDVGKMMRLHSLKIYLLRDLCS